MGTTGSLVYFLPCGISILSLDFAIMVDLFGDAPSRIVLSICMPSVRFLKGVTIGVLVPRGELSDLWAHEMA
jgi:hypothetical protein